MSIAPRHIQDYSNASSLEPHWGYADRVVPCTNDAGSCAYLDVVYGSHDIGMLYTGTIWGTILAVVFTAAIYQNLALGRSRAWTTIKVAFRKWLLPDLQHPILRWIFGRTSRYQVFLLTAIVGYLTIFSFAGITYAIWITPVKNSNLHNTRSSLGPWADRVGVLAYALTPLSILLASRESLLSVMTGIPYHHFNFLHRWLGHIILLQASLHTIGWSSTYLAIAWITQTYMIWGIVAMILLLLLWGLSTGYARRAFGYEFFRKAHYILAMLYIGACYAHWSALECFLIPGLLLWFLDRALRLFRTGLIHYQVLGNGSGVWNSIPCKTTYYPGNIVRLDIPGGRNPAAAAYSLGQHFYLTFPQHSIWQSHPFTPLSLPVSMGGNGGVSYLFRGKSGETKKIADTINNDSSENNNTLRVILTGPYGVDITKSLDQEDNVLCIAGGTGITFVLPVILALSKTPVRGKMQLIWVIRSSEDRAWIEDELAEITQNPDIVVSIYATRDGTCLASSASTSSEERAEKDTPGEEGISEGLELRSEGAKASQYRPDLVELIGHFTKGSSRDTCVYVSGPGGMISDVRRGVAESSDARRAWEGKGGNVKLIHDDRLE